MEANELLAPGRLLTGYVPGAEATAAVTALARRLRARDPQLIYLLDRECYFYARSFSPEETC